MAIYPFEINGAQHRIEADVAMPLLRVLRDGLNLTRTKFGCGAGLCGACTVHENGRAVPSCQVTVAKGGGKVLTRPLKDLSADGMHPCQRALIEIVRPSTCGRVVV